MLRLREAAAPVEDAESALEDAEDSEESTKSLATGYSHQRRNASSNIPEESEEVEDAVSELSDEPVPEEEESSVAEAELPEPVVLPALSLLLGDEEPVAPALATTPVTVAPLV